MSRFRDNNKHNFIKLLLENKWKIIFITFLTTIIATVYSYSIKDKWISNVEVTRPELLDFIDYFEIRREYTSISDTTDINEVELSENLFYRFKNVLVTRDEIGKFLELSKLYQKEDKKIDDIRRIELISSLSGNFEFDFSESLKNINNTKNKISFYAESAKLSQEILKGFISYSNKIALEKELNNFSILIKAKLSELTKKYKDLEWNAKLERALELEMVTQAYNIAKKLGVTEYYRNVNTLIVRELLNNNEKGYAHNIEKLVFLGEKYLKLQIEEMSKEEQIYPLEYYQIDVKIKQLELLLEKVKNVKADMFRYSYSSDSPTNKDDSNRILIIFLGLMLGFVISTLSILSMYFFREK